MVCMVDNWFLKILKTINPTNRAQEKIKELMIREIHGRKSF